MSQPTEAPTSRAYEEMIRYVQEAHLLEGSADVLGWDQETMLPPGGIEMRSRQLAQLASLHHRMVTDPKLGELLASCEGDAALLAEPTSVPAVNVCELRRAYDRATKLPAELVEEITKTSSLARHEWAEARKASDFARFEPWLEKLVALQRRKAECFGWPDGGEPWDALAEDYEPGCTAAQVEQVFGPLRERLQALIGEIAASSTRPSGTFHEVALPIPAQEAFVHHVAGQLGFDFDRGRLDRSTHPFTSGTHPGDVRMTTRFQETHVIDALGSTMHETGHAIYEQGLSSEHVGTPMGQAVSLGIHESQSRLWENQVGRSHAFWRWCHRQLQEFFGSAVAGFSVDDVYGAANLVEPGFIRVEADEATYNMHILVRFEIERGLLCGELAVADIPAAWNERYAKYLGLAVPDDRRGCLQDIHWSMGAIGYFPTYTLGNLYAAQFSEQALVSMPDLYEQIAQGEFAGLKGWLNREIHAHGRRYHAAALCEHVTGEPLNADPLMRHLEGKLRPLYGLA